MSKIYNIIKSLIVAVCVIGGSLGFFAGAHSNAEYHLSNMKVERVGDYLCVSVTVNPTEYKLRTNERMEITPVVRSIEGNDSIVLPSFAIAGRNSYYYTEREGRNSAYLMRSGKGVPYAYEAKVPWENWMEYSRMDLQSRTEGCCGVPTMPARDIPVVALDYRPVSYTPEFHYVAPAAETSKMRRIEGKAYVNFPVNRTEIYPDYMANPVELRKITSTIDTVRLNPDATVKSITLTGYASPEGPYLNNVRLAKGRTEAVKEYVRGQYSFPASVFHANSVPEDWTGLRYAVASGNLDDRAEILDFIDNGNVPVERRNDELKKRFPTSYAYLLKNVYPSLRHTDYAIDYELRIYTDVEEIKKVLRERPQNLSQNEFFLAANSYPAGSPESAQIFELAAMFFPDNDTANLNAANSAIGRGDYDRARMLLSRVSESPESIYAVAVLKAIEGDYQGAREGMQKAADGGVAEAVSALEQINKVLNKKDTIVYSSAFQD